MSAEQVNVNSLFSPTLQPNELLSGSSRAEKNSKNQSFAGALQQNMHGYDSRSTADEENGTITSADSMSRKSEAEHQQRHHGGNSFPPYEFDLNELADSGEQSISVLPITSVALDIDAAAKLNIIHSGKIENVLATQTPIDANIPVSESVSLLTASNIDALPFATGGASTASPITKLSMPDGFGNPVLTKSISTLPNVVENKVENPVVASTLGLTTDKLVSSEFISDKLIQQENAAQQSSLVSLQQRRLWSNVDMPVVSSAELNAQIKQNSGYTPTLNPVTDPFLSHNFLFNQSNNKLNSLGFFTTFSAKPIGTDLASKPVLNILGAESGFGLSIAQQQTVESTLPKSFFQLAATPNDVRWGEDLNNKLQILIQNNQQRAQFHINPKNMGPLDVHIMIGQDQQVSIGFNVQNAHLKEALDAAMPRLREMLQEQGLHLANVDVGQRESNGQQGQHTEDQGNSPVRETSNTEELLVTPEQYATDSIEVDGYLLKTLDLFV